MYDILICMFIMGLLEWYCHEDLNTDQYTKYEFLTVNTLQMDRQFFCFRSKSRNFIFIGRVLLVAYRSVNLNLTHADHFSISDPGRGGERRNATVFFINQANLNLSKRLI